MAKGGGGGGQRVGSLYVALWAKTDSFVKSMAGALGHVEKFSKKVAEASSKAGQLGAGFAAVGAAAIATAAKFNKGVEAQVNRQKAAWNTVANEVATALLPALDRMNDTVERAIGWWQGLDQGLKKSITSAAVAAIQFGILAGVVGKLAGLAGSVASLASSLAPVGLALAKVLLPLAVFYGLVLALRVAWDEGFFGMRDTLEEWAGIVAAGFKALFIAIQPMIGKLVDWFGEAFDNIRAIYVAWAVNFLFTIKTAFSAMGLDISAAVDLAIDAVAWVGHLTTRKGLSEFAGDASVSIGKMKDKAVADLDAISNKVGEVAARILGLSKGGKGKIVKDDWTKNFDWTDEQKAAMAAIDARNEAEKKAAESVEKLRQDKLQERLDREHKAATDTTNAQLELVNESYDQMVSGMTAAADSLRSRFAGRTGNAGAMVDVGMQGAAVGGGMGAVAAIGMELLTQSEQFQTAVAMFDEVIQMAADALGVVAEPLQLIAGAASNLVRTVMGALAPCFDLLAEQLERWAPLLQLVALLFAALAPVLEVAVKVLEPVFAAIGLAMRGLFEIIKWLAVGVLWVVKGIGEIWNGIINAVATVFDALASIEILGVRPLGFLGDWADSLRWARMDTEKLAKQIQELTNLSWDQAMALAEEEAARLRNKVAMDDATRQVDKFSESLTNVPEGFRVAAARYGAMDPSGFDPSMVRSGLTSGGGATIVVNGNIYGVEDLVALINAAQGRQSFASTGLVAAPSLATATAVGPSIGSAGGYLGTGF